VPCVFALLHGRSGKEGVPGEPADHTIAAGA
jgi:hypothetical protein